MPIVFPNSTTTQVLNDDDEGYLLPGRYIATLTGNAIESATSTDNGIRVQIDGTVAALNGSGIALGDGASGYGGNWVKIGQTGIVRGEASWGVVMFGYANRLENAGQIHGRQVVTMIDDGFDLANFGLITGSVSGVVLNGANGQAINSGTIAAPTALSMLGDSTYLFNSGTLLGDVDALALGSIAQVVRNTGDMIANYGAGVIASSDLLGLTLFNSGLISGHRGAIALVNAPGSPDHITNRGVMEGNVWLGGGDDTYLGGGGQVFGTVLGGAGADMLFGGALADTLRGEDGDDTLRGRAGDDDLDGGAGSDILYCGDGDDIALGGGRHDRLYGGRGDDVLDGGAGEDHLNGGRGDDRLTGGFLEDTFVFGRNSGHDVITDFQNGIDRIDLTAFGFAPGDFASMIAPALSAAGGGNTLLDLDMLGGDGSVLIEGLALAGAGVGDFIL